MIFSINGTMWQVQYENSNSSELKRSDNVSVLGVTDRNTHTIYLSNALRGFMQRKVLIHEVCHAICMSYDVYLPIEQEEILCDFVATYGDEVFEKTDTEKTPRQIIGIVSRGNASNLSYIISSLKEGEILRYEFELESLIKKEKKEVGFRKTLKTK